MLEHEIWTAIIGALREGLDTQGHAAIAIKQSYQPVKQGANTQNTVYLFKITSNRYGFQGKKGTFNPGNDNFDYVENYWLRATFQLTALINRDINDPSSITSYDIADLCAGILQTSAARDKLLQSKIGIERVTDVRNPFSIDDRDQFDQDSSFDFILTYNQTISSTVQKITSICPDVQRA